MDRERNNFEQIPEHERFLVQLPDNFDYEKAAHQVVKNIQEMIQGEFIKIYELILVIHSALNLPLEPNCRETTPVILDTIKKTQEQLGYPDPFEIFEKFKERRSRLLNLQDPN